MTEFYSKYYFQGLITSFFLKQLVWELIILIFLILMTIVPFLNGKVNFYTISSSIFFLFTIIIGLFGWIDSNFSRESIILGKDKIVLLTKYPFSKNKKVREINYQNIKLAEIYDEELGKISLSLKLLATTKLEIDEFWLKNLESSIADKSDILQDILENNLYLVLLGNFKQPEDVVQQINSNLNKF